MIFAGIALKLEKLSPAFSRFNPCPSLPSLQQTAGNDFTECLKTVVNNETGPLGLEFNAKKVLAF